MTCRVFITIMWWVFTSSQGRACCAVVDDYKEALGVNSRSELPLLPRIMQERINEHWMSQGVPCWIQPPFGLAPRSHLVWTFSGSPTNYALRQDLNWRELRGRPNTRLTDTICW